MDSKKAVSGDFVSPRHTYLFGNLSLSQGSSEDSNQLLYLASFHGDLENCYPLDHLAFTALSLPFVCIFYYQLQ